MPVPDALVDELQAVDPRLRIQKVSREQRPFLAAGRGDSPEPDAQALKGMLADAEVVIAAFEALAAATRSRIETLSAGRGAPSDRVCPSGEAGSRRRRRLAPES